MRCPACGHDVPEGDKFCGNCGAALEASQTGQEPSASQEKPEQAAAQPDAGPTDDAAADTTDIRGEREVWRGRYSNRAAAGGLLITFAVALILALLCTFLTLRFWEKQEGQHFMDVAVWIVAGAVVLAVLVRVLWRWLKYRFTLRYRLTTERLFIDKGLFSRTRDEIELIRVDDVRVKQRLMDRIFKVGQVRIISTDRTHGELVLLGIDEPDGVKEKIRQYMRARRKKSLHVESL
jgi:membrane protein YdbS with pleckstrin-like domain